MLSIVFYFCVIILLLFSVGDKPVDYFNLLVTDEFYELIVEESNRYAEEVYLSKVNYVRSRISNWRPMTVPELKIFFGLTLHMGTIRLNRLQDYWKTDRLFDLKSFSSYMSRDRYLGILRCLHFATNPRAGEMKPRDRLFKIKPLINYFNRKMMDIYYPDKELSLDESMVLWRGRLQFHQYIPYKKHKYGIKLYMLCEPNGIVLKFAVYTGALDDMGGTGHTERVVLHLLEEKLNAGHSVYMDNFYNSYCLSKTLLEQNTYSTGTLRISRKHTPIDVTRATLRKGETVCRYSKGVMIGKWRDKRDVVYISTEHVNTVVTYRDKRATEKSKPQAILQYNKFMGGVDRQDQYLSYYPFIRKTVRWYKKLGIHILQLLLINAHFLYAKYEKKKTFYDFRLEIIRVLLPEEMHKKVQHKVLNHFVSHCERSATTGKTLRRKCKLCTSKGIRKETAYFCKDCNVGFCLEPCFKEYHTKYKA